MMGAGHVFGNATSRVQIPLKSRIFFRLLLRNCINCVYNCQDHSSFDKILLLISQERKTLRNRTGKQFQYIKVWNNKPRPFFFEFNRYIYTNFSVTCPQHSKVDVNFDRFLFAASTEGNSIPHCLDTIVFISSISKRP